MNVACKRFFSAFIPMFLGMALTAAADESNSFSISAPAAQHPPKIDGTLNDPAWKTATHVRLDWDFTFRRAAEEPTDAYLLRRLEVFVRRICRKTA